MNQQEKGEEHGYFAFGGSTTIVIFKPGTIALDPDLVANSNRTIETLVKVRPLSLPLCTHVSSTS